MYEKPLSRATTPGILPSGKAEEASQAEPGCLSGFAAGMSGRSAHIAENGEKVRPVFLDRINVDLFIRGVNILQRGTH